MDGFRVAEELAPVEDVPIRYKHSGEGDTARGLVDERDSVATSDVTVEIILAGGLIKLVVPTFGGKSEHYLRFQHELTLLARRTGWDTIFTELSKLPDVRVGNMDRSLSDFQEQFDAYVVRMRIKAWEIWTRSLKGEKDGDVLFRIASLSAA